jgi:hypothetical protein
MWIRRLVVALGVFAVSFVAGHLWRTRVGAAARVEKVPDLVIGVSRPPASLDSELSLVGRVGMAMDLAVMPSVIALIDQTGPLHRRLVFIDRRTGNTLAVLGNDADKRIKYPYRLFKDAVVASRVWVLDNSTHSIYAIETEGGTIRLSGLDFSFPAGERFDGRPVWLNDLELVTAEIAAHDFLKVWSAPSRGGVLERRAAGGLSPYKRPAKQGSAPTLNRGTLAALGRGNLFVFESRYLSEIQIYDHDLALRQEIDGPVAVPVVFNDVAGVRSVSDGLFHRPDTRWTYTSGAANNGLVYGLFSGHAWAGVTEANIATDLQTFDETGRLLSDEVLPRSVYAIDVDVNGSVFVLRQTTPAVVELRSVSSNAAHGR